MSKSSKPKVIRTATIALSLDYLLKGQLAYLDRYAEVIAVSGQDQHLDTVREREGVKVVPLKMERAISPFKDFAALIKLYRLFRKEKPQIVHSITPKAGLLSMLAAKAAGVPVRIHTFTGLIFPSKTGMLQKILIGMDKLLCAAATRIIPEGLGVKQDLERFRITRKPLHILANGNVNGIDITYFDRDSIDQDTRGRLKNSLQIAEQDFVFVFVGRLVRDKGINELVAAFGAIAAQYPHARLLLVGNYEEALDPLLPETMAAIDNNKQIIPVGFQKDVRAYLAISDALVFPSYREGFPNVVLQAGAMGLPAIVTDINGCNEIIKDGTNGIIIPKQEEVALKKAMQTFLEKPEYLQQLKQNARPMIAERYRQEQVWAAIEALYRELLS